jgi:peptide-methionine (R)-S-oxide reductase
MTCINAKGIRIILMLILLVSVRCSNAQNKKTMEKDDSTKIAKTDDDWRKQLTPLQFHVTREKGTERAFTGEYDHFFEKGHYVCVCCGEKLFDSEHKYNSGCGWPAFNDLLTAKNIKKQTDTTHGMVRTEVMCAKCDAHLGHVFDDGPPPTRLRYCINSASIRFVPSKK